MGIVTATTRSHYGARGYGHQIGFGAAPAVIVVDFQRGLTEYDGSFRFGWNYDAEVEATARLLAAARGAGAPVVYTVVAYEPGAADGGILVEKIPGLKEFIIGSKEVEVDLRLPPDEHDFILVKKAQSAFFGTMLNTFLTVRSVDTLLIAGCTTSGCVRATVTEACSYGYRTMLVRDCIGDQAPEPHEANLFDMESKNADLVSLDAAVEYLLAERPQRSRNHKAERADFLKTGGGP